MTAKGDFKDYKDYVFKVQKKLKGERVWKVTNIVYDINVGERRAVNKKKGIYRAKCFGPANAARYSGRVKLKK